MRAAAETRGRPIVGGWRLPVRDALVGLWTDRRNTAWLRRLVRRRGWPGASVVGDDGAHAAWLLAQHADGSLPAQRLFLRALRDAVAPAYLAHLEDRVRVNSGRPQLYGTQYGLTEAGFGPWPVEDPERLDERRAAKGLKPHAEYDDEMRGASR